MRNPWLDIPLADYEAHMCMPAIGQARLIADQLEHLVRAHAPHSIAIVGCAGGNGFDRLLNTSARRVVGVDINPEYIEETRRRYEGLVPGLELYVADIEASKSLFDPVDLIYVALVLEYVDVGHTLRALGRHCSFNGVLAVLSQQAHETMGHISPSPYASLQQLTPRMRLVPQGELQSLASHAGFIPEESRTILSPGGKQFSVDEFRLCFVAPHAVGEAP